MSFVTIEEAREFMRVLHTQDDALIQSLIDGAEEEACRFLNRTQLPTLPVDYPDSSSSEDVPSADDPVSPDVVVAIKLLVQARYGIDTPEKQAKCRANAFEILQPYRRFIGV